MTKIRQLPVTQSTVRLPPRQIRRACDYTLAKAINDLETQVGTVEAYNKLCDAAGSLKRKIDMGAAQPQHHAYATNPDLIYPVGHAPTTA